jgi:hypothetical protein
MSNRHLLIKRLEECLSGWPRELRYVVVEYLRVRAYEWEPTARAAC